MWVRPLRRTAACRLCIALAGCRSPPMHASAVDALGSDCSVQGMTAHERRICSSDPFNLKRIHLLMLTRSVQASRDRYGSAMMLKWLLGR